MHNGTQDDHEGSGPPADVKAALAGPGEPRVVAPSSCGAAWRERHWFPVASVYELDPLRPTPVRIDGLALVVWHVPEKACGKKAAAGALPDPSGWRVFSDACPHRLAPLSEGRIEPKTGCLQCAYHGWEFDAEGKCKAMPSADIETCERNCTRPQASAVRFPSEVVFGIVWAWLGTEAPRDSPSSLFRGTPLEEEEIMKTYTRDLPYGYDTLVENLIDPAHVPFAHHGLQGTRDDAQPIPMEVKPGKGGGESMSFEFTDRTMGKIRHSYFTFMLPFLAYYRGQFEGDKAPFKLNFICVPVAPGESRIILIYTDKPGQGYRSKLHRLPVWAVHLWGNKFLDSDLAFLHYQERALRSAPRSADKWQSSYFMPAKCDKSISSWRRWLVSQKARCTTAEYAAELPPSPPRTALFDRYQQHTEHCVHCRRFLDAMVVWRSRFIGLGLGALTLDRLRVGPTSLWLAVQILSVGVIAGLHSFQQLFYSGGYMHYKT